MADLSNSREFISICREAAMKKSLSKLKRDSGKIGSKDYEEEILGILEVRRTKVFNLLAQGRKQI